MASTILVSQEGTLFRVTLNRPERQNLLDGASCEALLNALTKAEADRHVGAVLLTSTGEVFSAGFDYEAMHAEGFDRSLRVADELLSLFSRYRKPIVAAVQGPALDEAVGLLANCHVVVAAQGSSFGLVQIRSGRWPFLSFQALAFAIGPRRALELSLTGRVISAQEALQMGLAHMLAPAFELEERAESLAHHVARIDPVLSARVLTFIGETLRLGWEDLRMIARQAWLEAVEQTATGEVETK